MFTPSRITSLFATLALLLSSFSLINSAQAQGAAQITIAANTNITLTPRGMSPEETAKLQGSYPVSSDGILYSLPLLPNNGRFVAAGKTPEQLAREIEQAYIQNQIYTRISITIQAQGTNNPDRVLTLTMGGEVNRAGAVNWREGLTVIEAIALAGGRSQFAGKTIGIIRNGQETLIKLNDPQAKTMTLQANDYVEVWEAGMFRDIRPSR